MGYMFITAPCAACNEQISFAPSFVPSIRVNGEKQGICVECFKRWNAIHRTAKGLPPIAIHPRAYEPEECA